MLGRKWKLPIPVRGESDVFQPTTAAAAAPWIRFYLTCRVKSRSRTDQPCFIPLERTCARVVDRAISFSKSDDKGRAEVYALPHRAASSRSRTAGQQLRCPKSRATCPTPFRSADACTSRRIASARAHAYACTCVQNKIEAVFWTFDVTSAISSAHGKDFSAVADRSRRKSSVRATKWGLDEIINFANINTFVWIFIRIKTRFSSISWICYRNLSARANFSSGSQVTRSYFTH